MQLCAEGVAGEGRETLVVGRTLADDPPTRVEEAARLVMEAALGADAAHRVGVLHRDIKPANILVTPVSQRALVADFGLSAPHLYPEAAPGTPSTATVTIHLRDVPGPLVGTPSFMPPEQAWGEPATRTNDVYALGSTLYALLARRAPYQPSSKKGPLPALDVIRAVRAGPPVKLSAANPRVPARLLRIVDKAMDRDPDLRYQTAQALAEDLRRVRAYEPIVAKPVSRWTRLVRWGQRNPALALAVGVAATLLVVGTTVATLFAVQAGENLRQWDRLADLLRLRELVREADQDLWPAVPEKVPDMERWLNRARDLTAGLEGHRAGLEALRAEALPWTETERRRD